MRAALEASDKVAKLLAKELDTLGRTQIAQFKTLANGFLLTEFKSNYLLYNTNHYITTMKTN
jgi:glycerol-3-phosphate dehydrogenase